MIGFPQNRNLNEPQEMTPYQTQYHDKINKFHRIIVNKSRKIGATEAVIRSIAMNVFDRYQGHDIMIVAGNELRIATEILKRLDELFRDKPRSGYSFKEPGKDGNIWHYDELIRRSTFGNRPEIEFRNDTRVMAYAASMSGKSQGFRGTDDVVCIFLSEAAHTGMKRDQPIMNALEPNLANRDEGDFIMESTPNGKRGFFYEYWRSAMDYLAKKYGYASDEQLLAKLWNDSRKDSKLDWYPLMWDYTEGIKYKVLSRHYIDTQKRSTKIDFDQEYYCKFTSVYTQAIMTESLTFKDPTIPEYEKSIDLLGPEGINRPYAGFDYY